MLTIFIRTVLLYVTVVVGMRLMGKRQVGDLEPGELVIAILISELASAPMQNISEPLITGLIPIITLVTIEVLTSYLLCHSLKLRTLISGRPSILIKNGKIDEREMTKSRTTINELIEALRLQGVTDISQVHYGILETGGKLSVILFPQHTPLTPHTNTTPPQKTGLPFILINDGHILDHNLKPVSMTQDKLKKVMKQHGYSSTNQIFLLLCDEYHNVYIMPKEKS